MLKRHLIPTLSVLALVLMSTACGGGAAPTATPTPEPTRSPTYTPTPQAPTLAGPDCPDAFTEGQELGQVVEVAPQRSFTLTLGSTPAIPCGWRSPQIDNQTVVKQVGHQSQWPAAGATPQPGAPGTEIWVFETLAEGQSTISIDCVCLTEEGAQEEVRGSYVLDVLVEE